MDGCSPFPRSVGLRLKLLFCFCPVTAARPDAHVLHPHNPRSLDSYTTVLEIAYNGYHVGYETQFVRKGFNRGAMAWPAALCTCDCATLEQPKMFCSSNSPDQPIWWFFKNKLAKARKMQQLDPINSKTLTQYLIIHSLRMRAGVFPTVFAKIWASCYEGL